MESRVYHGNRSDDEGRPAGGVTWGRGFTIAWQDGPLAVDGVRREPNGAFVEDVIVAAIGRLEHYQASPFECEENARALAHLKEARESLRLRTSRRTEQGVEGSHQVHASVGGASPMEDPYAEGRHSVEYPCCPPDRVTPTPTDRVMERFIVVLGDGGPALVDLFGRFGRSEPRAVAKFADRSAAASAAKAFNEQHCERARAIDEQRQMMRDEIAS